MTSSNLMQQLDAMLRPASVAVIGASTSPGKLGHEVLKNIIDGGFRGEVFPVNPKADAILGLPCHAGIADIEKPPDLAVVIVPARFVPQTIEDCGRKGVKGAVIITGGFAEADADGERLQRQLLENAQKYGLRIIGPNCQGINNPHHLMCASWPLLTHQGKVAVIAQSGTVGAAMMDWLSEDHLGTSGFVSMGNRADVDETDLIAYFGQDPHSAVIAAYIEGIKRPQAFIETVQQLRKPLVVLKSGRTPKGKVAAESHTKSLAGADAVYEALFAKYGICRAYNLEEFYDFSKALAYLKPPAGNRILFITSSGGSAILATDQAEQEGLDVSPLPATLVDAITPLIPAHAIKANPLDLTGDATAEMFADVMRTAAGHYDTLGIIFGDPVEDASRIVTPRADELVIFLGGAEVQRHESRLMHRKGVPVFPTPERGIRALARVISREGLAKPQAPTILEAAPGRQLTPLAAMERVARQGLPCIDSASAKDRDQAVAAARRQGFPVVLKISSTDIVHKSDVGGVKLNLSSERAVAEAYDEMLASMQAQQPAAHIEGVLVSPMAPPGLEVIVGMNRDPQFGPVILFGLGGVMVELFQDVSLGLLPLSEEDALRMIREIKGYRLIAGYRGRPAADAHSLVGILLGVARMAEENPQIAEIDLNPVIVYPDGAKIVDARIIER